MPTRKVPAPAALTGGQAQYVINRLLKDRRVSAGEVRAYVADMQHEIDTLEEQLRFLRAASGLSAMPASRSKVPGARRSRRAAGDTSATTRAPRKRRGRKRRHQNLSPERRAALKLQGHFLALMRRIPASKRPQYKAVFREKGAQAAINALREEVRK